MMRFQPFQPPPLKADIGLHGRIGCHGLTPDEDRHSGRKSFESTPQLGPKPIAFIAITNVRIPESAKGTDGLAQPFSHAFGAGNN